MHIKNQLTSSILHFLCHKHTGAPKNTSRWHTDFIWGSNVPKAL